MCPESRLRDQRHLWSRTKKKTTTLAPSHPQTLEPSHPQILTPEAQSLTLADGCPSFSSSLLLASLELSDTKVYEPSIGALLGTASHFCEDVVQLTTMDRKVDASPERARNVEMKEKT